MSVKLKAGIIGCGGIANGKHMHGLHSLDTVEMVAFCDIIVSRAQEAKEKFGTSDALVFESYKEMLDKAGVDVVFVCTPNSSHCEISVAALNAGCHVMCEKPMAMNYAEGKLMVETAKKAGKKLTIGYQNRFRADSEYLKRSCQNGDLGEIYFAKAHAVRRRAVPTWGVFLDAEKQGGGPLIDIGTHALDLTLWFMDNYKPKMVVGKTYRKLADQVETANAWGDWDPDVFTVEDSAFAYITMENGATIFLESSWALNILDTKEAVCTLCGTKAGADFDNDELRINQVNYGKQVTVKPTLSADGVAFYGGEKREPHQIEAARWIDSIINDKSPVVLPEQALVVTQILEAVYESAKTGKPVFFD